MTEESDPTATTLTIKKITTMANWQALHQSQSLPCHSCQCTLLVWFWFMLLTAQLHIVHNEIIHTPQTIISLFTQPWGFQSSKGTLQTLILHLITVSQMWHHTSTRPKHKDLLAFLLLQLTHGMCGWWLNPHVHVTICLHQVQRPLCICCRGTVPPYPTLVGLTLDCADSCRMNATNE